MYKIDFLEFTIQQDIYNQLQVQEYIFPFLEILIPKEKLFITDDKLIERGGDRNLRLEKGFELHGIQVKYSPIIINQPSHVRIGGKALDTFERNNPGCVKRLIKKISDFWNCLDDRSNCVARISRLDIAFDDFINPFKYYKNKVVNKEYISWSKSDAKFVGDACGHTGTYYIGKRGSKAMVRIYDKIQELIDKENKELYFSSSGEILLDGINNINNKTWMRVEYETRAGVARFIGKLIADELDVPNFLLDAFRIIEERIEANMARCEIDKKFLELLNCTDEIKRIQRENKESDSFGWFHSTVIPLVKSYIISQGKEQFDKILNEAENSKPFLKALEEFMKESEHKKIIEQPLN